MKKSIITISSLVLVCLFVVVGCNSDNTVESNPEGQFVNPYSFVGEEHNRILSEYVQTYRENISPSTFREHFFDGDLNRSDDEFETIFNDIFGEELENSASTSKNKTLSYVAQVVENELNEVYTKVINRDPDYAIEQLCEITVNQYSEHHPKSVSVCSAIATYFSSRDYWNSIDLSDLGSGDNEVMIANWVLCDALGAGYGAGSSYWEDHENGDDWDHSGALESGLVWAFRGSAFYFAKSHYSMRK